MESLIAMGDGVSQVWAGWMWPMTWQIALMGVVILGVALAVRKASPRFRYFLWCLVLVKLCLPPSFAFVTGVGRWVLPKQTAAVTVMTEPLPVMEALLPETPPASIGSATEPEPGVAPALPPAPISAPVAVAESAFHVSWTTGLWGIWCLGVAALSVFFAIQHRRIGRLLAAGRTIDDEKVLGLLAEAKVALGVSRRVRLLSVETLHSPILFGLFRPCIAIPRYALETLPGDRIRPILLHELAHLKRKDLWLSYAQMLAQIAYWFHPVVWLANRQLRRERELIVDDVVLAKLEGRRESYSASLLSILRQGVQSRFFTPAYVGIVETPGSLGRRLKRIVDTRRKLSLRLGWAGLLAVIALGLVLIPQARSQEQPAVAPETEVSQGSAAETEVAPDVKEPFRVRGEVVGPDGQPIEGARLILYHNKSRWGMDNRVVEEARSAADGSFAFKDRIAFDQIISHSYVQDSYVLLAMHPDYAFAWENIRQGSMPESYRLTLTAPRTQVVTVTGPDGRPIPEARVRVSFAGDRNAIEPEFRSYLRLPTEIEALTVVTDAQGEATLNNLPDTRCYFIAAIPGYASNFGLEGNRIRLSLGAYIIGRVVTEDGKPVSDATVWLYPDYRYNFFLWARTDANGRFEFNDVPPKGWGGNAEVSGRYRVTLRSDRLAAPEQTVELLPGATVGNLTFKAVAGTKVRVQALDPETKEPISGARIRGFTGADERINGYTDANGIAEWALSPGTVVRFHLMSPPNGTYMVQDPGGQGLTEGVAVGDEAMNVVLHAPGKVGRLISLRGRVQLPDGKPAAGVRITHTEQERYHTAGRVGGSGTRASADAAGAFELTGLPAGLKSFIYGETENREYVLAQEITLPAESGEWPQALVMQKGQAAEIELKDEKGQPRRDMALRLCPSKWRYQIGWTTDWAQREVRTGRDGKLRVGGIVPGMEYFIIDANANRGRPDWWSKYFYTTTVLLPAVPGDTKAPPVKLVAPRAADRAFIKVVDPKGKVVPVTGMSNLVIMTDGNIPWHPGLDLPIFARLEDGTVVTDRRGVSLAKPGQTVTITVSTETTQDMEASGVYPTDGSSRLLLTTKGGMATMQVTSANLDENVAEVRVVDPEDQPLANAKVTIVRTAFAEHNPTAVTDNNGSVTFKDIPKRYRYVEVEVSGYALHWTPRLAPGKALTVRMQNTTRLAGRLVLPDGKTTGRSSIKLVCKRLADPSGADVEFASFPLVLEGDEQGKYDSLLMPGVYDIEALSASGYFGKWPDVRVARGKTTALPEQLAPAARLELKVVDRLTSKAVAGMEFSIQDSALGSLWAREDGARTTDANGVAVWEALVPGSVGVDVDRKQCARCWSDQSTLRSSKGPPPAKPQRRDGLSRLVFNVTPDMKPVKVYVERVVTVTGRVLNPEGQPVEGASVDVCLTSSHHPMTSDARYACRATDADGAYTLKLPAGNGLAYAVIAHDPQDRWANAVSKPFESKPGDELSFDLKLTNGGQVSGRVLDPNGKPMANTWVKAVPTGGIALYYYFPKAETDEQGRFTIKAVRPGQYSVFPMASRYAQSASGDTKRVTVKRQATVSVGDLVCKLPPQRNP